MVVPWARIKREQIALAVGLFMLLNGLSSILWGTVNDRLGLLPTVTMGTLLLCGCLWVTSFGRTATLFYLSIPAAGIAEGAVSPGIVLGTIIAHAFALFCLCRRL